MVRSLWASIIENPERFKAINGWLTVFWIIMIPISYALGWLTSVTFVSALSLYAIVTGHLSTWQAARVEVKQEYAEDSQDEQLHEKVDEVRRKVDA